MACLRPFAQDVNCEEGKSQTLLHMELYTHRTSPASGYSQQRWLGRPFSNLGR